MTQTQPSGIGLSGEHPPLICFVCTGNTCRSPMAAAVFNHFAKEAGREERALSAGLAVCETAISQNAVRALEEAGILCTPENDYKAHIPAAVNERLAGECQQLIGITGSHAMALMTRFPQAASKIFALPQDISDPYGGDLSRYRQCLAEITAAVKEGFGL